MPILDWETSTFSIPTLGLLLFASIALSPAVFIPSSPSMWIGGMTFGYGYGFLLIMAGASIGMSLPYLIGSSFRHKIHVSSSFFLVKSYGFYFLMKITYFQTYKYVLLIFFF